MSSLLTECLMLALWNVTAVKCALGSAVIMAPLWALIIKPLLQRLLPSSKASTAAKRSNNYRAASPSGGAAAAATEGARRSRVSPSPSPRRRVGSEDATPRQRQVKRPATAPVAVTNEALSGLFRSPEFVHWYSEHRDSLLGRARVRCAQRAWTSLATVVVLLLAVFVLPLFSFVNEDETLWALLQRRCVGGSLMTRESVTGNFTVQDFLPQLWAKLEPLLLLVAGLALLTTAFMPADAKNTASVTIAAFLALVIEAALVEHVAVGAGLMALLGVVMWRVVCSCG